MKNSHDENKSDTMNNALTKLFSQSKDALEKLTKEYNKLNLNSYDKESISEDSKTCNNAYKEIADFIVKMESFYRNACNLFKSKDGQLLTVYMVITNDPSSIWNKLIHHNFDYEKAINDKRNYNCQKEAEELLYKLVPVSKKGSRSKSYILSKAYRALLEVTTKESAREGTPAWFYVTWKRLISYPDRERLLPFNKRQVAPAYLGRIINNELVTENKNNSKFQTYDDHLKYADNVKCTKTVPLSDEESELYITILEVLIESGISKRSLARNLGFKKPFLYALLKRQRRFPRGRINNLTKYIQSLSSDIKERLSDYLQ